MRLFAALDLPDDVRDSLLALGGGMPGARWTPHDNLHLTLRFADDVDAATFRDWSMTLAEVDMPSFDLTLKGLGMFAAGREARTLWAGVEHAAALTRLREKVERAARMAGLPPDARKFTPHVTLARLRDVRRDKMQEFLSRHGLYRSRPFLIDGFTLYSSHLAREGAVHRPEVEYIFSDAEREEDGDDRWQAWETRADEE